MISAVVPVFDEEESLQNFYNELVNELSKLTDRYEILFIDDGSRDSTLDILKELEKKDNNVKAYSFRRNHGKAEALTFGFQKAKGDLIVTLDADLQDRPSEISKLIEKNKDGFDVVSGWRKNRKDSFAKIIFSKMFNFMASTFWNVRLHDYNCGLKLYTNDAAKSLNLYGGMHRFIPLLVAQEGFRVTEVPVVHDVRKFGKSKYSAWKVLTQMPDMMTMLFLSKFSQRPLHFFGFIGGILVFIGLLIGSYMTILRLLGETIGNRPLLLLGLLLIITGMQVGFTGLIADLILNVSRKDKFESLNLRYEHQK
jgi:glycosyltransferase involved in cell wall biosynthesis